MNEQERRRATGTTSSGPVPSSGLGACTGAPGAEEVVPEAVVAPPGHEFDSLSIDRDCQCGFLSQPRLYGVQARVEAWAAHLRELPKVITVNEARDRDGVLGPPVASPQEFTGMTVDFGMTLLEMVGLAAAGRCMACSWPVVEAAQHGCVQGNCSYRPDPHAVGYSRWWARTQALTFARLYASGQVTFRRPT